MKNLFDKLSEGLDELDNESGMEAAQVILILFLVVVGLIPIIVTIRNTLANRASSTNNSIPTG